MTTTIKIRQQINIKNSCCLFVILFVVVIISLIIKTSVAKLENSQFGNLFLHLNEPICADLFRENVPTPTLQAAKSWERPKNATLTDKQLYRQITDNCDRFLTNSKYLVKLPKTKDEENLSIAFSIVVFKNAFQVERLLRTIYRPWNYYCFHVDRKSPKTFFRAIEALVKCLDGKFHNIVNTRHRVDVRWAQFTVLQADLNCMKELYERYGDWKYFINLTGQEFPLKTNAELAKILTAFKGANSIEGTYKRRNEDRIPTVKLPIPVVWFKGSVHITVNRDFVKFIFTSPKSKLLLDALKGRGVPDEQFFSTLNFNSQFMIPGSYIGDPDEMSTPDEPLKYFLTRYKNWGEYSCKSALYVRAICIWGVGDLPKLIKAPHLQINYMKTLNQQHYVVWRDGIMTKLMQKLILEEYQLM